MSYDTLEFEVDDGVARVTLARPGAANAIDLVMGKELLDVALRCDEATGVRAVLLAAQGPAEAGRSKFFCAGGDLASFADARDELPRLLKELTGQLHAAISRFARMRAPVVAAVEGAAAGAGFSLLCACDLVVAAESSRFTMAYTRAGLAPDGSSTYFLPRLIGGRRTLELMLTNRTLSAAEALEWGLVNRVVADDRAMEEAWGLARELAKGPTAAYGLVKDLVLRSAVEGLESQMEHESRAIADAARTADAKEGIAAFFEKRAARFGGR